MTTFKKRIATLAAVPLLLLLAWLLIPSQKHSRGQAATTDAFIAAVMEEAAIPGLAVAVIRNGEVVMLRGYGLANVERKTKVTTETLFSVASISKPIVGVALLQLFDQGVLDLDADINGYLPFRVDNPKVQGETITARHLATHTSGIADYYDERTYSNNVDSPVPLRTHLESLLTPSGDQYQGGTRYLPAMPGTQREYSNLAAGVAGQLVEQATGENFAAFSRRAIFEPLGMRRTSWLLHDLDLGEIATPYEVEQCIPWTGICADTTSPKANAIIGELFDPPLAYKHFNAYPHFGNPQYPDGGVRTSIDDLARFLVALLDADRSPALLSPKAREEMFKVQLAPEVDVRQRFFWRDDRAGRIGHMGSDLGVYTSLYFDLTSRDAVIVLMNRGVDLRAEEAMEAINERLWATIAAENPTASVGQSSFVSIGGIDQWIRIKGEDRNNPVLLVVHGGPGESQWPVADKYVPWEKAFTVVLWDQRGAGHTYGLHGARTPDFTLDRIARDGVEVADYLRRTLGKKKIIVLGHSWGTIVATEMVQLRPELFAAYVGTGQVASWNATVNMQYDLAFDKARHDGDAAAIRQLEATGRPDPSNAKQAFSVNIWPVMAPTDQAWIQALRAQAPELKAKHPKDFQDFEAGFKFSAEQALPYQMRADLPRTASKIDTAFFVIQGQDDVITPTEAAVDYFDGVVAPKKELILIPNAGHFAFMTASDAFLAALTDKVREVAIKRGG